MKNIYSFKLLLALCLVLTLQVLTSCEEDDTSSGQVTLLSFGPSGVKHGEQIKFIGHNLDKVSSIVLPPGIEVTSAEFVSQSREVIEVVVPEATEAGKVVIKTSDGEIESKTVLSFEVPVSISSFTPEVKPGTNLTIKGQFVNWIESVAFADDVLATEFVSKSLNEVVVVVPMEANTGRLVFFTGGTEPLEIESETDLQVILPTITALAPDPVQRGGELTITGTDLDLVNEVRLKGNVAVPESEFIRKSETEIVIIFPENANKGTVGVVTYSGVEVESAQSITVEGDLPPLEALASPFYTDALQNGWQKWGGWGSGSSDLANTENVRDGEKAIKVIFAGDWGGSMQLGGATASTTGHTELALSIYGATGTGGKQVNLVLKNGAAATEKIITIIEGEWTEYKFSIANDLGGMTSITELFLQDRGWSGTLYVDHIGLR